MKNVGDWVKKLDVKHAVKIELKYLLNRVRESAPLYLYWTPTDKLQGSDVWFQKNHNFVTEADDCACKFELSMNKIYNQSGMVSQSFLLPVNAK